MKYVLFVDAKASKPVPHVTDEGPVELDRILCDATFSEDELERAGTFEAVFEMVTARLNQAMHEIVKKDPDARVERYCFGAMKS